MQIVIAGASGFLGTHCATPWSGAATPWSRSSGGPRSAPDESSWDPYAGTYDRAVVEAADVVVNLAGSPTVGNPHSAKWARELRESRVTTTRDAGRGDRGDASGSRRSWPATGSATTATGATRCSTEESDSRGDALLTSVTREWQAAAEPAVEAGARVCVLRTAPVMDRRSEPLKQLRLLFRTGLGARLGDGRQYMPIISLRDWVGAVVHLAEHGSASGPFNLCCPKTPTNAEFTDALARQLSRPSFVVAPTALIKVGAGRDGPRAPELAQRPPRSPRGRGLHVPGPRRRRGAPGRPGPVS